VILTFEIQFVLAFFNREWDHPKNKTINTPLLSAFVLWISYFLVKKEPEIPSRSEIEIGQCELIKKTRISAGLRSEINRKSVPEKS
jgi:hypothetical protein